jgi:hypothetical protein
VEIVTSLAKNGATDADVAAALGVSIRTVWRWQVEHSAFCQALVVPPGAPDDRVERSLFQRSVGYTYDAEKVFQHNGQPVRVPVTEHVPPDPGAAMKWLTNRRPDRWRDKQSLEHTGADGKDLPPPESPRDIARAVLAIIQEGAKVQGNALPPYEDDADYAPDDDGIAGDDQSHIDRTSQHIAKTPETAKRSGEAEAPLPQQPSPRVRVFNPVTGRLE